jgi:hypothetical protein
MTFKGKEVKVAITGDAKEEFERMNRAIEKEIERGITKSETQTLMSSIKNKIELLKQNPQYGAHIQKSLIPEEYGQKYDANNLWKINLAGAWRMIYNEN